MARVTFSAGMLLSLASSRAWRRRALADGSPPPMRAATVISLITLVKMRPFLASCAPFLCFILDPLLWPLMADSLPCTQAAPPNGAALGSDADRAPLYHSPPGP